MGEAKRRRKLDKSYGQQKMKLNNQGFTCSSKNPVVSEILSLIINDKKLIEPFYLKEIKSEEDCNNSHGKSPLVFLWSNQDHNNYFSITINGKFLGGIMELFCERSDPGFADIRDEVSLVLSQVSARVVDEIVEETKVSPKEIFKWVDLENNSCYKDWSYLKFTKSLIKEALESKDKDKLDKYLDTLMYLTFERYKHFFLEIISDLLKEVSYSVFYWYTRNYTPDVEILDEDDPTLGDGIISYSIQMLIQDGLVLGQDFSFYIDEDDRRHIKFSADARDKMKPETLEYLNNITD